MLIENILEKNWAKTSVCSTWLLQTKRSENKWNNDNKKNALKSDNFSSWVRKIKVVINKNIDIYVIILNKLKTIKKNKPD